MKKRRSPGPAPDAAAEDGGLRPCDMPGCSANGEYPAPRARDALKDYYWFCLAHVREYNAAWNYYAGMSEAEIERHIRADTTWWRPTWPLGTGRGPTMRPERMWFADAFNVFGEEWVEGAARAGAAAEDDRRRSRAVTPEEKALAVLELSPPVTRARVKARYLELVKRLHPDANGGDKSAEEKLKLINRAYTTLKNAQLG